MALIRAGWGDSGSTSSLHWPVLCYFCGDLVVVEFSGDGLCDASVNRNMRVNCHKVDLSCITPAEFSVAREVPTGDICRYQPN